MAQFLLNVDKIIFLSGLMFHSYKANIASKILPIWLISSIFGCWKQKLSKQFQLDYSNAYDFGFDIKKESFTQTSRDRLLVTIELTSAVQSNWFVGANPIRLGGLIHALANFPENKICSAALA
ncbi:MAG: hypothetical protein WAO88_10190 [Roseicyclus sp.]|uniref:hypothetical protein n=1 Tax=Roseicyclus sp. TaxID=1914329 RepID=UPI003BAF279B